MSSSTHQVEYDQSRKTASTGTNFRRLKYIPGPRPLPGI
jgi:hypothetical protein